MAIKCYNNKMKFVIFISPSKTFSHTTQKGETPILFPDKTKSLKRKLLRLERDDFVKKMNLSTKLAEEVFFYFREEDKAKALTLYSGVSYKAMDAATLNVNNDKLYILDAYYGLVRPSDGIERYRLDFSMSLVGNLYRHWETVVKKYIVEHHREDILIDLASKEFSPLLPKTLKVIRIDFVLTEKKISNVLLKQMRGKMARHLIDQNINDVVALSEVVIDGFAYHPSLSDECHYIFARDI